MAKKIKNKLMGRDIIKNRAMGIAYILMLNASGLYDINNPLHTAYSNYKHGSIEDFLNDMMKIGCKRDWMVCWHNGIIKNENEISQKSEGTMVMLMTATSAIQKFYNTLSSIFGHSFIIDNKINNIDQSYFFKFAEYEIALRILSELPDGKFQYNKNLEDIINSLILTEKEKDCLHLGRKAYNFIKHPPKEKKRNAIFNDIDDALLQFDKSYKTYINVYDIYNDRLSFFTFK